MNHNCNSHQLLLIFLKNFSSVPHTQVLFSWKGFSNPPAYHLPSFPPVLLLSTSCALPCTAFQAAGVPFHRAARSSLARGTCLRAVVILSSFSFTWNSPTWMFFQNTQLTLCYLLIMKCRGSRTSFMLKSAPAAAGIKHTEKIRGKMQVLRNLNRRATGYATGLKYSVLTW